jgi:hypothetical protein
MSGHTWTDILADWYGINMRPEVAERWQRWVKEEMSDVQPGEAADALLWAAKEQRFSFPQGKPTVAAVIMCIKWRRKEMSAQRRAGAYKTDDKRGYLNAVWAQMMRAMRIGDAELCWNVLCSPKYYARLERDPQPEECQQLYAKLLERYPDFTKPKWDWTLSEYHGPIALTVEEMYA